MLYSYSHIVLVVFLTYQFLLKSRMMSQQCLALIMSLFVTVIREKHKTR